MRASPHPQGLQRGIPTAKRVGMEARTGFEPVNTGFADPCLTTWLPRRSVTDSKIGGIRTIASKIFLTYSEDLLYNNVMTRIRWRSRYIPIIAWAAISLPLIITSCASRSERRQIAQQRQEIATERAQAGRILIPESAVRLRNDQAHPPFSIRQTFTWHAFGNIWRLLVVDPRAEYAGFDVKVPYDLHRKRRHMILFFELWPITAGDHLAIALLDGGARGNRMLAPLALAPYEADVRRFNKPGWSSYAIPLTEFKEAYPLDDTSEQGGAFDWRDVSGVRIIRLNTEEGSPSQFTIENLCFTPHTWIDER